MSPPCDEIFTTVQMGLPEDSSTSAAAVVDGLLELARRQLIEEGRPLRALESCRLALHVVGPGNAGNGGNGDNEDGGAGGAGRARGGDAGGNIGSGSNEKGSENDADGRAKALFHSGRLWLRGVASWYAGAGCFEEGSLQFAATPRSPEFSLRHRQGKNCNTS